MGATAAAHLSAEAAVCAPTALLNVRNPERLYTTCWHTSPEYPEMRPGIPDTQWQAPAAVQRPLPEHCSPAAPTPHVTLHDAP